MWNENFCVYSECRGKRSILTCCFNHALLLNNNQKFYNIMLRNYMRQGNFYHGARHIGDVKWNLYLRKTVYCGISWKARICSAFGCQSSPVC